MPAQFTLLAYWQALPYLLKERSHKSAIFSVPYFAHSELQGRGNGR
jgi:hypothetical protein